MLERDHFGTAKFFAEERLRGPRAPSTRSFLPPTLTRRAFLQQKYATIYDNKRYVSATKRAHPCDNVPGR